MTRIIVMGGDSPDVVVEAARAQRRARRVDEHMKRLLAVPAPAEENVGRIPRPPPWFQASAQDFAVHGGRIPTRPDDWPTTTKGDQ